jgi:UDPglucose--hexose-1-phosphate uridylyltransferase
MNLDLISKESHRRYNPLLREWVLVSPHRTNRPWQGQVESIEPATPEYVADCYLCPGNQRAGGHQNPNYENVFVFENDFAALRPDVAARSTDLENRGLVRAQTEAGICRVLCFSPRHNLTVSRMSKPDFGLVVDAWTREFEELAAIPSIQYVQIFENHGTMMGASNPHPHCQIWASESIPNEPAKEAEAMRAYKQVHKSCLLCDYGSLEERLGDRVVTQNEGFLAVVPFWAVWPFETLVLSRRHLGGLCDLSRMERSALAEILQEVTTRYDRLFATSFPYSMGLHQRPVDGAPHEESHFHAHFYPPLLRSAVVRKFMVGYELLATPQRDFTAESAAVRLRDAG